MTIYVLVVGYDDTFDSLYRTREEAEKVASSLDYDMWEILERTL